jgi:hypothetical protein
MIEFHRPRNGWSYSEGVCSVFVMIERDSEHAEDTPTMDAEMDAVIAIK